MKLKERTLAFHRAAGAVAHFEEISNCQTSHRRPRYDCGGGESQSPVTQMSFAGARRDLIPAAAPQTNLMPPQLLALFRFGFRSIRGGFFFFVFAPDTQAGFRFCNVIGSESQSANVARESFLRSLATAFPGELKRGLRGREVHFEKLQRGKKTIGIAPTAHKT